MNKSHLVLSASVGIIGGIAVWLSHGALNAVYSLWVGFIAWALFFANGGDNDAAKNTILSGIYGAVLAGLFFALSGSVDIAGALNGPVWIAITVFVLMMGTQIEMFGNAPTAVVGYAATAGYTIHGSLPDLVTTMQLSNPVIFVALSIIIGTIFGMISGKVASALE
ncbi:MAG: DUF1097 domain-containing protein [Pseudomonadota bacterium]|nr:DUF1097 domain-containing protein [Pseudomonadota bacterium]|tara:strand:- start:5486 stop:5983 length:498 start_codon:yes stop_codon:yes gene_type:complete